jgi:hypothetical protein
MKRCSTIMSFRSIIWWIPASTSQKLASCILTLEPGTTITFQ